MKKTVAAAVLLFSAVVLTFAENADKVVAFESKVHDFGDIVMTDGAVTCTFTFKNISNSPIVVHNVVSSCGCTTPDWTKEPVLPGKEGVIKARFSNDQGEGAFDKTLTVYISSIDRPVVLRLRGYSHEKEKDIKQMYDVLAGPVGFHKSSFSLGYIDQGSAKEDHVQIVNTGKSAVEVSADGVPEGLTVTFTPSVIPGRQFSEMHYKLDLSRIRQQIWGRQSFKFKLKINGTVQPTELKINAMVKDNFDSLTKADIAKAPAIATDKSYFEFGQIRKGEVVQGAFTIRNKGKKPLVLHAIDSQASGSVTTAPCPITVQPGKNYNLRFSFDTSKIKESGETVNVLSIVTNDPGKPILNLFISGIITE